MTDQIRILLADDHAIVRKGLRLSLEEDSGLKVVAEVPDGEAALAAVRELQSDVAVLDIDMPNLDGFGVAREIKCSRARPALPYIKGASERCKSPEASQ